MGEEKLNIVDAIGWILDSIDEPLSITEITGQINTGYLSEPIVNTPVNEEEVRKAVEQNLKSFDFEYDIASLPGQKYKTETIDGFIKNIDNKNSVLLFLLLIVRYELVRESKSLYNFGIRDFINLIYTKPDQINLDSLSKVINTVITEYSVPILDIDIFRLADKDSVIDFFNQHSEKELYNKVRNAANIISKLRWDSVSDDKFDKIFEDLTTYDYSSNRVETLLKIIADISDAKTIAGDGTKYGSLLNAIEIPKNRKVELIGDNKIELLISALRLSLKGIKHVNLKWCYFSSIGSERDAFIMRISEENLGVFRHLPKIPIIQDTTTFEEYYFKSIVKRLSNTGKAYLILPKKVLTDNKNRNIREQLVQNKFVETVVELPQHFVEPRRTHILLIINKQNKNKPLFVYSNNIENNNFNNVLADLLGILKNNIEYTDQEISRYVNWDEFKNKDYKLDAWTYLNPSNFSKHYKRKEHEKIKKIENVTQRIKSEKVEVNNKYPFVNMVDLPPNEGEYLLDKENLSFKKSFKQKVPLLKEDALLLGRVGVLKPTLFRYSGTPIYIGPNIITLKIYEDQIDKEYLISELHSNFVIKQLDGIVKGRTIPSMSINDILDISLRVPQLHEQKDYFTDWINNIAQKKIEAIKELHSEVNIIGKEVFSTFAHDYGKKIVSISGGLEIITSYIKELGYRGIINMNDSVLFENKAEVGESVKEVLNRLNSNFVAAQEFLESEVKYYTGESTVNNKILELNKLFSDWKKRQAQQGYKIYMGDIFTSIGDNDPKDFKVAYSTMGNKNDLFSVLDNLLDNAIEHGFKNKNEDCEFVIKLQPASDVTGNFHNTIMHIGNNGDPFPEDFTCEDLFKLHHKGPDSKGQGKGGYSMKRRLNKMGATIKCESSELPKDKYPVQFEIHFKPVQYE